MGGCATKPKVVKGEEGEALAPAPAPELTKEPIPAATEPTKEPVPVAPETKDQGADPEGENVNEIVKARNIEVDETAKEFVVDDKEDDQANKRQSLSNLFKEKETKELAECDNAPSEPVQQDTFPVEEDSSKPLKEEPVEPAKEEQIETENLKSTSETINQEAEKPANPIEHTSEQDPAETPGKIETEKTIEAIPVPETQNKETPADDKDDKTEVAK